MTENTLFQQAVLRYKHRDYATAQKYMRQVLLADPTNIPAWLWMSTLVSDAVQKRECLQRALALDPTCEPARRGLQILQSQQQAPAAVAAPPDMPPQAHKLGAYLIERGLISTVQLENALEEQRLLKKKGQGLRVPLGTILVNNGTVSPETLAVALIAQQHDKLQGQHQSPRYLGEYLVAQKRITSHQLEKALAEQMRLRRRGKTLLLGELLVQAGYINDDDLVSILDMQQDDLFSRFEF